MSDVTRILSEIESGDPHAAEQLLPLVYDELRKLAAAKLAREKPGQTLQATALVHDAYLRLVDAEKAQHWNSRNHFFRAAAESMRRILVETARRKASQKRGGRLARQEFDSSALAETSRPKEVIAVHDALDELAAEDPLAADLVKLHYFGGFSLEETAELLGQSRATAYRTWSFARAWLRNRIHEDLHPEQSER
jgi:RNA polymerase sigma factor (TIGR02999 family)